MQRFLVSSGSPRAGVIRTGLVLALLTVATLGFSPPVHAMDIKYEKYQLENGMTVILHQDRALPVVCVNLWYRVGSKDEKRGRSGFAHLFEHLMFMGTERVPDNQFDLVMESGGGSNNATTSSDRTNYFSSGPARLLPTLLWLEADRLEDLARTMTQEKLDTQREVVRNERRQSYENRPYGKAELEIQGMMYPVGHPYNIPVIGTHADLEAATVNDVKNFFATYYVPNNVNLCVAGDFDVAETKKLIESLFGSLPRGAEAPNADAEPVKLDEVKRSTVVDKVQLPLVAQSWHSPALYADGDAECDLIAAVLTEGKTSRLYKRLVIDEQLAAEVGAYQDSSVLGSTFRIDVTAVPGADLDRVEEIVWEEVKRLIADGPTKEELERHQASIELQMLSRLQSVDAKADRLNSYEFYRGEPNSFAWDLARYRDASAASVKGWAKKIFVEERVVMRVLPQEPQRAETGRDAKPTLGAQSAFAPSSPATFELENGLKVMLWEKGELPLVAMSLHAKPGGSLDHTAANAGLAHLTADMLDEGAGDLDALAFGDALQLLGSRVSATVDHETLAVSFFGLKRNLDQASRLYADAIRRPRLQDEDWKRVRRLHLEDLKQSQDNPRTIARNVTLRQMYGDATPYGWPVSGTSGTVEALTLDAVKSNHRRLLRPDRATLLIAGDLSIAEAKPLVEELFGDWKAADGASDIVKIDAAPEPSAGDALRIFVVDRPDAVQTVVRFILPGTTFRDEHRIELELINTLLGGSFTSRLNQNLREKHGYSYGAGSAFVMQPRIGYFIAASNVRADVTGESIGEFLNELKGVRSGSSITAGEVEKARETLRTEQIETFAGISGVLGAAGELLANGMPFETLAADMKAMEAVTDADLNAVVKDAIPLERGILVLVGDKALIEKEIAELGGLPAPVEVDVHGAVKK